MSISLFPELGDKWECLAGNGMSTMPIRQFECSPEV